MKIMSAEEYLQDKEYLARGVVIVDVKAAYNACNEQWRDKHKALLEELRGMFPRKDDEWWDESELRGVPVPGVLSLKLEDAMKVRCTKCNYVDDKGKFKTGRDFFQKEYISGCPKCNNHQSPGNASLRMMPDMEHPFVFVRDENPDDNPLNKTLHNASEAS